MTRIEMYKGCGEYGLIIVMMIGADALEISTYRSQQLIRGVFRASSTFLKGECAPSACKLLNQKQGMDLIIKLL